MSLEDKVAKPKVLQQAEEVAFKHIVLTALVEATTKEITFEERVASYSEDKEIEREIDAENRAAAAQFELYSSRITNLAGKLPKPVAGAYLNFLKLNYAIRHGEILRYPLARKYQQLSEYQSNRETDIAQIRKDLAIAREIGDAGQIQAIDDIMARYGNLVQTYEIHKRLIADFLKVLYPKIQFPEQVPESKGY